MERNTKKKTMKTIEINWEEVPQEYNYVAMDACGDIYAYVLKPGTKLLDWEMGIVECNFWIDDDHEPNTINQIDLEVEDPENYNWKILHERPSITDRDS